MYVLGRTRCLAQWEQWTMKFRYKYSKITNNECPGKSINFEIRLSASM